MTDERDPGNLYRGIVTHVASVNAAGAFLFGAGALMRHVRIWVALAWMCMLPVVSAWAGNPTVAKGDHIEAVVAGLARVAADQTADIQDVCPGAAPGVLHATLWGPPGSTPDAATVQTFRLEASLHPFAAAFYLGRDVHEEPVGLAVADHRGIVTGVYTGDPSSWPVLCDSL